MQPFVCHNMPFVVPSGIEIQPSVRRLVPFVFNGVMVRGFTLVELVLTLTVAAILVAIAIPQLGQFLRSHRLSTDVNDLVADISYARSEGLKRTINVGVCKSDNRATCTASGSWASGWIVFVDADSSGGWTAGDQVLRAHDPLPASISVAAAAADTLYYNSQALLESGVGPYTFCSAQIGQSRTISILAGGRATVIRGTC